MPTVLMNEDEIKAFVTIYQAFLKPTPNEYMSYFMSGDGFSVSIYKSGKVVFQGSQLSYFSDYLKKNDEEEAQYPYDFMNTIGSDEVGTCDFTLFPKSYYLLQNIEKDDIIKLKHNKSNTSQKMQNRNILSKTNKD